MQGSFIVNIIGCLLFTGCGSSNSEIENQSNETIIDTSTIDSANTEDTIAEIEVPKGESWQDFSDPYKHFNGSISDTVYIGPNREIKDPFEYFSETQSNQFVVIEEGKYVGESSLWLDGENLIVEGRGKVSILLDVLYDNVMWVIGQNVVINNLHMTHLQPGGTEDQNCSGRVIGFDGADNVTIINCDLNGCGLAGLHDNLGNGTVYAENNWIHNNSLGAYTDIDGNIWQKEGEHPVFKFKNNFIEDNGHGLEVYDYPEEGEYDEEYDGH